MKNKKITLCDATIHPGEVANLALPLPELFSCSPLYMPIKVIHGTQEGPCLVVLSVLNGDELNGLEISNRTTRSLSPRSLKGTVITIPVLNVYGLTHYPSNLPSDVKLENCFPGDENGSYGERLAYLITQEILKKADICIELQTGQLNHNILPQVYCNFENPKAKTLAKVFQAPVITKVDTEDNYLRSTTEELHIPLLVYQAGEALRFDENAISLGCQGIKNVMCALNMLAEEPTNDVTPIFSRDEDWILAHKGGILHADVQLGQAVERGEIIGTVTDPFGTDNTEPVKAVKKGIVVGVNSSPLIHEGLAIFKIASFLDYDKAENAIEEWDKMQPDSYIG